MSDKKNDNTDIFSSPLSNSAKKALLGNMDGSTKDLKRLQKGADDVTINLLQKDEDLLSNITSKVNKVFSNITNNGNSSDIGNEILDNMVLMSKKHKYIDTTEKKSKSKKIDDELELLKNSVTEGNENNIDQLMQLHKVKTMDAMATYNLIIRIIPKMRLLLNTYVTSILSPDDLTSSKVNITLTQENLDQEQKNKIIKNELFKK